MTIHLGRIVWMKFPAHQGRLMKGTWTGLGEFTYASGHYDSEPYLCVTIGEHVTDPLTGDWIVQLVSHRYLKEGLRTILTLEEAVVVVTPPPRRPKPFDPLW